MSWKNDQEPFKGGCLAFVERKVMKDAAKRSQQHLMPQEPHGRFCADKASLSHAIMIEGQRAKEREFPSLRRERLGSEMAQRSKSCTVLFWQRS